MKKIILIFALTIIILSLHSQTEQTYTEAFDSIFSNISRTEATTGILYERMMPFAQENSTVSNNRVKKYAYQFIGEVLYPQTGIGMHLSNFHIDETFWNFCRIGVHFINNMVYKEKMSIGLGVGMEHTILSGIGFPIFADFRCYFAEKKLRPFIDIGIGTIITLYSPHFTIFQNNLYVEKPGFYFNCTGGFKYKHFQFHAGINIRTNEGDVNYDINDFYLHLDGVIKCGFNF
jgi:hypothetical protein